MKIQGLFLQLIIPAALQVISLTKIIGFYHSRATA